jgi:hypothetical protein
MHPSQASPQGALASKPMEHGRFRDPSQHICGLLHHFCFHHVVFPDIARGSYDGKHELVKFGICCRRWLFYHPLFCARSACVQRTCGSYS